MTQIQFKTKGSRKVIPKVYKTKKIRLKTTLHRLGYPQPPYTADQLEVFLKNITVSVEPNILLVDVATPGPNKKKRVGLYVFCIVK